MSDKIDRRKVIIFACLGAAVAGVILTFIGRYWEPGLLVAAGFFGLFAFPVYALCVAHLNDNVEADGFVEAASGLLLVFALGAVIGPILASTAMRFFGPEILFGFTAIVHVFVAAFIIYRMRKREAPSVDDRVQFSDSMRVAQTVSTVDPCDEQYYGKTPGPESPGR